MARAKGWQVWAVERRENLLEDHTMLDSAKAGQATPQQLLDYYLGYLDDPAVSAGHFRLLGDAEVGFAREWGMRTEIEDLRRVVRRASAPRRQGRPRRPLARRHDHDGVRDVGLRGRPGARGLSGLVFIDGGSGREPISADDADARAAGSWESGSPWLSFGGIGAPFAGMFNSGGSALVRIAPDAASLAQGFRLLPENLKPPVPATNAGLYGFALDTGHLARAARRGTGVPGPARTGRRAPGDGFDGGELTPLRRFADMFSGWGLKGLDGTAWYHPLRLTIDGGAVAAGNDNPVQRRLGMRAVHGDDLPRELRIYAFAASLGGSRVLGAARTAGPPVRHPAASPDARRPQRHLRPQRSELGRTAPQRVPEGPDPVPGADRALTPGATPARRARSAIATRTASTPCHSGWYAPFTSTAAGWGGGSVGGGALRHGLQ